jgi:hypothetical protein
MTHVLMKLFEKTNKVQLNLQQKEPKENPKQNPPAVDRITMYVTQHNPNEKSLLCTMHVPMTADI